MVCRFPRSCRGVYLVVLLFLTSFTMRSRASTVKVLSSEEMDFPQGLQSVLVELRSGGYDVEVETSDALEPGRLLEVLETRGSADAIAKVAVVKVGRGGIAYVWLKESGQTYRVTASGTDPSHAANVLSLRVSELISLGGEGFEIDQSPRRITPVEPATDVAPSTPESRQSHLRLLGFFGPVFDSGLRRPLSSLQVALGYQLGANLFVELLGHTSVGMSTQRFEQALVSVEERGGAMSLVFQTGTRVLGQLGPTFGAGCYVIRARPNRGPSTDENACRATLGALGRIGLSWDALSIWLSGQVGYGLRRIDLVGSGEVLSSLSQPDGSLRLGAGWQF